MLSVFLVTAASVEPVPAIGQWVVDFAEEQCVASRAFGDIKNPWHLVVKPSPTSDVVQLILINKRGRRDAVQEEVQLKLGKSAPIKVKELRYSIKDNGIRLVNLAPDQAAALAQAEVIEWVGDGSDWGFSIGPVEQLMKTLATCREDLRKHWNISPDKEATLRARARPSRSIVRYFSTDDYPRQAVWNGEGGVTSVALLIDEMGAIQDCMVDGTSGIATLDAQTCIILRTRGKFEAAIDKNGKPARHYFMQKVRWEMP